MVKFDRFIFVDWSASATPKKGKDSIWIGSCESSCENKFDFVDLTDNFHKNGNNENLWKIFLAKPSSVNTLKRTDALTFLEGILKQCNNNDKNKKTLIGFDFGFGYPCEAYDVNGIGKDWESLWQNFYKAFYKEDYEKGKERLRFKLANKWNKDHSLCFWGEPNTKEDKKPIGLKKEKVSNIMRDVGEFRITEERVRWSGVKSQWQLYGAGSVGSQTLLGIPYVEKLRQCLGREKVRVWPFETKFATDIKNNLEVLICEIHFGALFRVQERIARRTEAIKCQNKSPELPKEYPKDRIQVEEMCRFFAEDNRGLLEKFLKVDCACVSDADKEIAQTKEGWILGVPLCLQPCDRSHKK